MRENFVVRISECGDTRAGVGEELEAKRRDDHSCPEVPTPAQLLTMGQAADYVRERTGQSCSPNSVWRWGRKGCSGVKLVLVRYGRQFYTTAQALEAFSKALGAARELPEGIDPQRVVRRPPRLVTERQRAAQQARTNRVLEEAGLK